jgi:hypothetical protein
MKECSEDPWPPDSETPDKKIRRTKHGSVQGNMDRLTLFGLFAVTAMLLCYALESRSRWFILAFAASCVLGSAYGFLQGGLAIRIDRGCLVHCGGAAMADRCGAVPMNNLAFSLGFTRFQQSVILNNE